MIRKRIPEMLDLILTPLLTLLLSLLVGLIFIGPILMNLEQLIAEVVKAFIILPFGIGGIIYGGGIQLLAITGMHHAITPISLQLVAQTGQDIIHPLATASIAGQAGAGAAIAFLQRDKVKRSRVLSSVMPAIFGITEPILFATNLPKVKPFLMGCIGGAIGGGIAGILNLAAAGTGAAMIPGLLLYLGNGWSMYLLVILVSFIISLILTYISMDKELAQD